MKVKTHHLQLDDEKVSSGRDVSESSRICKNLITPTATSNTQKPTNTPDTVVSEESDFSSDNDEDDEVEGDFENELEEAQWEATLSTEALVNLAKGVRIVTRLMQRYHHHPIPAVSKKESSDLTTDDNPEKRLADRKSSYMDEGEQSLANLTEELGGEIGSDLLGLVNTANMVREHVRLSSEEASTLVDDIRIAQDEMEEAKHRAQKAETASLRLHKQNVVLKKEVKKLRMHRSALIHEVKKLRTEVEETRKYDSWRLLEDHIIGAIHIHETCLRDHLHNDKVVDGLLGKSSKNENDVGQPSSCNAPEGSVLGTETSATREVDLHRDLGGDKQASGIIVLTNKSGADSSESKSARTLGFTGAIDFASTTSQGKKSGGFLQSGKNRHHNFKAMFCQSSVPKTAGDNAGNVDKPFDGSSTKAANPHTKLGGTDQVFPMSFKGGSAGFRMDKLFSRNISLTRGSHRSPLISLGAIPSSAKGGHIKQEMNVQSKIIQEVSIANDGDPKRPVLTTEIGITKDVSFASEEEEIAFHLPTPTFGSDGSTVENSLANLKPTCDPQIVRSLALPSNDDDCREEGESPRTQVAPGRFLV